MLCCTSQYWYGCPALSQTTAGAHNMSHVTCGRRMRKQLTSRNRRSFVITSTQYWKYANSSQLSIDRLLLMLLHVLILVLCRPFLLALCLRAALLLFHVHRLSAVRRTLTRLLRRQPKEMNRIAFKSSSNTVCSCNGQLYYLTTRRSARLYDRLPLL